MLPDCFKKLKNVCLEKELTSDSIMSREQKGKGLVTSFVSDDLTFNKSSVSVESQLMLGSRSVCVDSRFLVNTVVSGSGLISDCCLVSCKFVGNFNIQNSFFEVCRVVGDIMVCGNSLVATYSTFSGSFLVSGCGSYFNTKVIFSAFFGNVRVYPGSYISSSHLYNSVVSGPAHLSGCKVFNSSLPAGVYTNLIITKSPLVFTYENISLVSHFDDADSWAICWCVPEKRVFTSLRYKKEDLMVVSIKKDIFDSIIKLKREGITKVARLRSYVDGSDEVLVDEYIRQQEESLRSFINNSLSALQESYNAGTNTKSRLVEDAQNRRLLL